MPATIRQIWNHTPFLQPILGLLLACSVAMGGMFGFANSALLMQRVLTETIISPMFPAKPDEPAPFFEADSFGRVYISGFSTTKAQSADSQADEPAIEEAAPDLSSPFLRKLVTVKRGDTLGKILAAGEAASREAYAATAALRRHFNPTSLKPGQQVTLLYGNDPAQNFAGLEIETAPGTILTVSRKNDGSFESSSITAELERRIAAARTPISTSLFEAGASLGVPTQVMANLIHIFSWDVDFQRDIHAGDQFSVMFEQYYSPSGKLAHNGEILFASLTLGGEEKAIYRFEDSDGIVDYYGPDGKSIRKALLKTPIDGARLSSGFGMRKHPVLGYSKMHKGVDFAAPSGTPIFAAGDGVVEQIGPWSSYGNYLRIRHNGSLSTAYAHLKRYGKGLKKGARITQGQIIGYVGSTGRATGPHLHYEVIMAGKQVSPTSVNLPTGREVSRKEKPAFQGIVAQRQGEYQQALARAPVQTAANR